MLTDAKSIDGLLSDQSLDAKRRHFERKKRARLDALRRELVELTCVGGPLVLELGCGHGHFLTAYAMAHPNSMCVGIDFCRERIRRAGRKQCRLALANVCFCRAEIGEFLDALPSAIRFADVFVLFPDPWPKRRHRKKRLISGVFLSRLAESVRSGGRLFFRTDSADYFQEVARLVSGSADWTISPDGVWEFYCATVFQEKAQDYRSLCAIRLG